jgi:hypothetical protein
MLPRKPTAMKISCRSSRVVVCGTHMNRQGFHCDTQKNDSFTRDWIVTALSFSVVRGTGQQRYGELERLVDAKADYIQECAYS